MTPPETSRPTTDTAEPPDASVTPDAPGTPDAGQDARRRVADELRAAVRAVQSGERSADSFFPQPAVRRPAPGAGRGGGPARQPTAEQVEGVARLLAEGGAPRELAAPAMAALGEDAERLLRVDPWRLLAVPSVRPEQADGFATALLAARGEPGGAESPEDLRGSPHRTRALAAWLLERAARAGHTAVDLPSAAQGLAQHGVPDPRAALRDAVDCGAVLAFHEIGPEAGAGHGAETAASDATAEATGDLGDEADPSARQPADRVILGLERYALAEESLADGLARLLGTADTAVVDRDRWEAAAAAAPHPAVAALARAAAGCGLLTHTGGEAALAEPVALVAVARSLGMRACVASHTADGRRRVARLLPDGDQDAAVTVAGLLAGQEGPRRGPDGQLPVDVLAVLDAAQLGVEAAALLVEALPDGCRLVLSGDPSHIGGAGPGQVLNDVLAAEVCPHLPSAAVEPGPVGRLLSKIGDGRLPRVEAPDREVVIVPVSEAAEAVHRTVQLVTDSIPRAFGEPTERVQVITPVHGGAAGTRALNAALKERLNPGPGRFGGFDAGDRVIYSPVPGRVVPAMVTDADDRGLWLEDADIGRFAVARERVTDAVRHGWALTAHQAAGSRWPAVVVVLPGDAVAALDRSWVYTAFGRAARHLSVVHGAGDALPRAVAGPATAGRPRTTRLRPLLREQAVAAGIGAGQERV